jgi:acyl carrier protein
MNARTTLLKTFASALCVPESAEVLEAAEFRRIAQWDSLAHMRLVAGIETAFDIMLDTEDVIGMNSFRKAVDIVGKHGVDIT